MEILRLSVGEPSSAAHRSPHQDRRAPDRSAAGSRPSSTHSCNQYRKNPDNPPPPPQSYQGLDSVLRSKDEGFGRHRRKIGSNENSLAVGAGFTWIEADPSRAAGSPSRLPAQMGFSSFPRDLDGTTRRRRTGRREGVARAQRRRTTAGGGRRGGWRRGEDGKGRGRH